MYDKKKEKLICCPSCRSSIILPESTTQIGFDACTYCNIQTLDASHTKLDTIGSGAFHHCQKLQSITLPETLTHICQGAFGQTGLKEIHFPKNLKSLDDRAFRECHQLQEIDLSDTQVDDLSMNTFQGCKNLTRIKLPKNLKKLSPVEWLPVSNSLMGGYTKLEKVFSFMCPNLAEVEFPEKFAKEHLEIVEKVQKELEANKKRMEMGKEEKGERKEQSEKDTPSYGEED